MRVFTALGLWAVAHVGLTIAAIAHDDVNGRPHFKGTRANPTAVMKALQADSQAALSVAALSGTPCANGFADVYPCENIDLLAFLPFVDIGGASVQTRGNDIWGWTGAGLSREFALVGRNDGTAFVEISDPYNPVFLGRLPTHTGASTWRDIKVYADHAYIVSEASGHGMQIFDLTRLLTADPAAAAIAFTDSGYYGEFGSAHNLVINEDSGYAYAVGTATCAGGLHIIDLVDPKVPTKAGCFSDDGYTHDAQCVSYTGPDTDYSGVSEICVAANENTLTLVDVTVKGAPRQIARVTYPGEGYTHQAWFDESYARKLVTEISGGVFS